MTQPESDPDLASLTRQLVAVAVERGELALEQQQQMLRVVETTTAWFKDAPVVTAEQYQAFAEIFDRLANVFEGQVRGFSPAIELVPTILAQALNVPVDQRCDTFKAQAQALETCAATLRLAAAVHVARATVESRREQP